MELEKQNLIKYYKLNWQPKTKTGQITLYLENKQGYKLELDSAADLVGVVVLLQNSPIWLLADGSLSTTWETDFDE